MKALSNKEEEIMELFWEKGPMHVKQLLEFYDDPKPHFNTLSTFVRGLETKGFIGHEALGNTYLYHATVSRDEYKRRTLRGVISKYFNNSFLGMVSTLVKEEDISVDELKELVRLVEEKNKNGGVKTFD
jgi:predicted transcriptional regulator